MKNVILIIVLLFFQVPLSLFAQRNVRGVLLDSSTELPIPSATVYISGSSIGTITDTNGFFLLRQVPTQPTTLVISAMGYETYTQMLAAGDHGLNLGQINLQVQPKLLEEVYLTAYHKTLRVQRMKVFLDEFVGKTPNARKTKLMNPEDVHTFLDENTGMIQVRTDRPLRFVNEALGYLINVDLMLFEGNAISGYRMQGHYYFAPLSGSKQKLRTYKKARQEAYLFSSKRFFHQLYMEEPAWQDYEVYRMDREVNAEKNRVSDLLNQFRQKHDQQKKPVESFSNFLSKFYHPDSLRYFAIVQNQDSILWVKDEEPIRFSEAIHWKDQQAFVKEKGIFGIRFLHKPNRFGWKPFDAVNDLDAVILIKEDGVHINANGFIYPPLKLTLGGAWSWNGRLGDMLALEYLPDEDD